MAKVLGFGGVFVKTADPKALRDWYARVLGFEVTPWGGVMWPHPAVGNINWTTFPADSDYFDPSKQPFMINFIVDDLAGVLAKAKAEGAELVGEPTDSEYGRFGWLMDPDGRKIELWEPPPEASET